MVDQRFYINKSPYHLEAIARHIGCEIAPPNIARQSFDAMISDIAPLSSAKIGDLTFLSNKKYDKLLQTTLAKACIIGKDHLGSVPQNMLLLQSDNPYYSYALAVDMFYGPLMNQDDNQAMIHHSAIIGANCKIAPHVVIEANVEIGNDAKIGAGTFIGHGVKIGNNARIDANVTISYSIIGDNVVILPGARIGQDGFGFATHQGKHYKIFHVGRVMIGNDVEIGANSCIDRGSMQDTIISDDCRIDNLVQIGHNVKIGKGSIIVAQAGIAGSSVIGDYCALGGQVGIAGHLTIADRVQIAGQGGVIQNVTETGIILGGTPAIAIRDWHRQSIALKNLVKNKR